jgi:hypothetical protein
MEQRLVTAEHQSCISARICLREYLLLKDSIIALQMATVREMWRRRRFDLTESWLVTDSLMSAI